MDSVLEELKADARRLHRDAESGDAAALARLKTDPKAMESGLQRRHCLAAIAKELGFSGWPHAVAVLGGVDDKDFGTMLYPEGGAAHTNIWSASYDEARAIREQTGGYLLAYKHQFFIVESHFIVTIGLDPDDPDWEAIGRDWVRPTDPAARARLYAKLVAVRRASGRSRRTGEG